jgi:hypothetical protein
LSISNDRVSLIYLLFTLKTLLAMTRRSEMLLLRQHESNIS